jgi:hypothetical protein
LELIIPDRDSLADQTTVRNSSQHMQFFDLFASLYRDPADCPSVIHRHALYFVRHLYVFRAAQCKSMAIRARERSRYWRGSAHSFALLGREGFLLMRVVIYATVSPQAAGIRARRHRSKLPYHVKPQRRCPPKWIQVRVAPSNGSHLLTHRCILVAARRLAGPIARSIAAHLKTSHPHFPIKQA